MDRNEIKSITNELLSLSTPENQARTSELLTILSEGCETLLTTSEGYETRIEELAANNEKLRSVNADLFLKVGTPTAGTPSTDPAPDTSETETITFESLFNDKGELI